MNYRYRFIDLGFECFSLGFGVEAVEHIREQIGRAFQNHAHDPELLKISVRCPNHKHLDFESFQRFVNRMSLPVADGIGAPCYVTYQELLPSGLRVDVWEVIAWHGCVTRFRREAGTSRWDLMAVTIPPGVDAKSLDRRWAEAYYAVRDLRPRALANERTNFQCHLPRNSVIEHDAGGLPLRVDPSRWSKPPFLPEDWR
jgi:hypothetical protein